MNALTSEKPLAARITNVTTQKVGKNNMDYVFVQFNIDRKMYERSFDSAIFNEANIYAWRRIVLGACTGEKLEEKDTRVATFNEYRSALIGKDVFIGIASDVIFAIGKDKANLFFPDVYKLLDIPGQDNFEK